MLTSRVSLSDMTNQITALELTAERPEMVRSIIELIMADTISTCLDDEEYSHLRHLFIQPGQDIVEKYRQVTASIFLFDEYRQLLPLVDQLIDNIGADLFSKMWEADESSTLREVLRCFGHGCSFWDSWDYTGFLGIDKMPKLKTTLKSPYYVAAQVLDKIAEREILNDMLDVDSHLGKTIGFSATANTDFLGKFIPLYNLLSREFKVSGHSCGNSQHQISLVLPINTFTYVKRGFHIRNTVSPDGEFYLKQVLRVLSAYGFNELVAFPSAGVEVISLEN